MNAHMHTTPAQPMTSDQFDEVVAETTALVHQLSFLICDLEEGFRVSRGEPFHETGVKLIFQNSNIDATLWLAGETWSRASNLRDRLRKIEAAFDASEGGAS